MISNSQHLERSDAQIFWGDVAANEHVVQLYEHHNSFIDLLFGFVSGGIRAGDSVILIATSEHIDNISEKLKSNGFDPFTLKLRNQFISLSAEECLSKFMVNGQPDEILFNAFAKNILKKAKTFGRQVRAFGEMVAILWAEGNETATLKLEALWHKLCKEHDFSLFCAYPQNVLAKDGLRAMAEICDCHQKVIHELDENNEIAYSLSKAV